MRTNLNVDTRKLGKTRKSNLLFNGRAQPMRDVINYENIISSTGRDVGYKRI